MKTIVRATRPMGRVQWRLQNGQGSEYDLNYTYDYLGDVRSATNGAGVTISSTYNNAAELSGVTSSLNDAHHPGTLLEGPQYNALGQVTTDNLGFLNEHYGYTNRGWLFSYWACMVPGNSCSSSQMAYTFNMQTGNNQQPLGFAPNGDVVAANDWINGNWTYAYDAFNRLSTSYCGTNCPGAQSALGFNYLYDRFGNRWQQNGTAGSGPHPQVSFDNNGHITGSGVLYDAAGNMVGDGSHSYIYDAENRVIQVDGTSGQCSTAAACYVYNASRQRVTKSTSAGTVYYAYDIAGHQVAEFSSTGAWNRGEVYAGSKHLATYVGGTSGSTYLDLADWVGTERMRVNSTQSPQETCTGLPFGDMQSCTGTDESPMHFTGQQWDSEDNLTAFWFRTDSTTQGRWGSMDPSGLAAVDPSNPQTWNRYSYVGNNPTSYVDPLGLYWGCVQAGGGPATCTWYADDPPPQYEASVGLSNYCDYHPWDRHCQDLPDTPVGPNRNAANNGFTLGIRAPEQTWSQCMAANANTYSIGGSVELAGNVATGTNTSYSSNVLVGAVTGNSVNTLFFGSGADAAAGMGANAPGLVSTAMGSATTFGRRTSAIMSLNLAGTPGGPAVALSQASGGVKAVLGQIGDALSLGMSFATRTAVDVGFTGAEAFNCAIPR